MGSWFLTDLWHQPRVEVCLQHRSFPILLGALVGTSSSWGWRQVLSLSTGSLSPCAQQPNGSLWRYCAKCILSSASLRRCPYRAGKNVIFSLLCSWFLKTRIIYVPGSLEEVMGVSPRKRDGKRLQIQSLLRRLKKQTF